MTPTRRGFLGMVAGVLGALGLSRLAGATPARSVYVAGAYRDELALIEAEIQWAWERDYVLCFGRHGRVVHAVRRDKLSATSRYVLMVEFPPINKVEFGPVWIPGDDRVVRMTLYQVSGPDMRPLDRYLSMPRWNGMSREGWWSTYAELRW